jgi:hypothetical protein
MSLGYAGFCQSTARSHVNVLVSCLRHFADKEGLTDVDVWMLASVNFRGRQPTNDEGGSGLPDSLVSVRDLRQRSRRGRSPGSFGTFGHSPW